MLPSRGVGLTGPGLRCIRPTPRRLQATRQLSQRSSSRSLSLSKTPCRPIRPSPSSLATIGRANISLWPWSSKKESLGFSPPPATREGTPDPSSVSAFATDTQNAATSAPNPSQSSEPPNVVDSKMDPTPLPLGSTDDSILAAIQTPVISEDHYGFLREMGLNYGFPYVTNTLEIIMENIHIYAGTEWWATIALSAIAVRAIMTVPMAIGSHHMAKLEAIKPWTEAAKEKLEKAKDSGDTMAMLEAQKELKDLMKAVGAKLVWPLMPMFLQAFFGFCAFKLMRAMTALPVPGLETGGALWFLDLTVPDPWYVIPITMGLLMHLIGRLGGELGSQAASSPGMRNIMLYILPTGITTVVAFQAAALQVSFLTAMTWGACQGYLFRQAWFRKYFQMEALPKSRSEDPEPSKVPQAKVAPSASGKPVRTLRTVSPIALEYKAPRARAQREMAVFHPPKEMETKKPAAPAKGTFQKITDSSEAVSRPVKERAEEYESRRRTEKKWEAETRRQGSR